MTGPARKNYGKDDLKNGDIVYVWGRQNTPYRIKSIDGIRCVLEDFRGFTFVGWYNDIKLAPPGGDSRFLHLRKDYKDRTKAQRQQTKAEQAQAQDELREFAEFCNSNPATALDGEMWRRLRELSPRALGEFVNSNFRMPFKW